jgi:hypothetical protein
VSDDVHDNHASELTPRRLERAATWVSVACALHCLLVPFVSLLLPALGTSEVVHMNAGLDRALTTLVIVSVGLATVWGFKRHRDLRVAAGVLLGMAVYLWGHALEGTGYGTPVSVLGGLLLAGASFAGARLGHSCGHAH